MGTRRAEGHVRCFPASLSGFGWILPLAAVMAASAPLRAETTVSPLLEVAETWSSNINLAADGEEEASWVTEVAPAVHYQATGSRTDLYLDYRLQSLFYSSDSDRNNTYQQGRLEASRKLVEEWLSIGVTGSISQLQDLTSGQSGYDNISGGKRTDVKRFGAEPVLRHSFGTLVDVESRLRRDWVRYSGDLSNSRNDSFLLRAASGERLRRLRWGASYRSYRSLRSTSYDISTRSALATTGYSATRKLDLVAEVGYEYRDSEGSDAQRFNNGSYWGGGLGWRPSRRFSATLLGGGRYKRASLSLQPTANTYARVNWYDRTVGSNPGTSWTADVAINRRHASYRIGYFEEVTTYQQMELLGNCWDQETNTYSFECSTDDGTFWEFTGEVYVLTDEEFLRKRGWATIALQGRRNSIALSTYREDRTYLLSENDETRYGGTASWRLSLGRRSDLTTQIYARIGEYSDSTLDERLVRLSLVLTRNLSKRLRLQTGLSRAQRDDRDGASDYTENRIFARVRLEY